MSFITKKQHKILVEQVKYNFEIIEQLDKAFDSYSTKFNDYDIKIADLDTDVSSCDAKIADFEQKLTDLLDTTIVTMEINISNNANNISALDYKFTESKKDVKTNADNITKLNSSITSLNDRISANITTTDNLKTQKQDKLTAGTGITITNNVISSTGGDSTKLYKGTALITMSDGAYFYLSFITPVTQDAGTITWPDLFNKYLKLSAVVPVFSSSAIKYIRYQAGSVIRYNISGTIELSDSSTALKSCEILIFREIGTI